MTDWQPSAPIEWEADPDLPLLARPLWHQLAACRDLDPAIFYPPRGGDLRTPQAICRACPVAEQCLEWAIDHHEHFGVWGGVSERGRQRIRRERRRELAG